MKQNDSNTKKAANKQASQYNDVHEKTIACACPSKPSTIEISDTLSLQINLRIKVSLQHQSPSLTTKISNPKPNSVAIYNDNNIANNCQHKY